MTKIIVLTPVKNEEWVLEKFLSVTSLFADCIIIADQGSTDDSRNICARFPKVHVVNNNGAFNEDSRQLLLIETARRLFPDEQRILFGLDADEIISADSIEDEEPWKRIRALMPGTSIYVEKPDLLSGLGKCIRWRENYFPIGYVDDGITHRPRAIHSRRIPENPSGENVQVHDIKIMHFAHTRRNVQSSKQRYYSVLENIKRNNPLYLRRHTYKCFYRDEHYPQENIEDTPAKWLRGWDEREIDLRNLPDPNFSWHDFEVLSYFKEYGFKRFYMDDIWEYDWEECRQYALQSGKDVPATPIEKPGRFYTGTAKVLDSLYYLYRQAQI